EEADRQVGALPPGQFHRLIHRGRLGWYWSDAKVKMQRGLHRLARRLGRAGGAASMFFYWNGKAYRFWQEQQKRLSFS
ncbi:DUF2600 family protein, partial [Geobacillus stearothermophilus]|uniref:DUF2600 family protein n=1 Tax=Geobacillus stearothermophilus TaxID=1422 RepID=UPI002E21BBCF|nr:DUF2600 family protein [Geobacillus stearothermophilus]